MVTLSVKPTKSKLSVSAKPLQKQRDNYLIDSTTGERGRVLEPLNSKPEYHRKTAMTNKYIEKIASFKGFRANRLGLRELTIGNGGTREQHTALLKRIRSRAKEVGNVEMEPGFMAEAAELRKLQSKVPVLPSNTSSVEKAIESKNNVARSYLEGKYPKGMDSMYRMEL